MGIKASYHSYSWLRKLNRTRVSILLRYLSLKGALNHQIFISVDNTRHPRASLGTHFDIVSFRSPTDSFTLSALVQSLPQCQTLRRIPLDASLGYGHVKGEGLLWKECLHCQTQALQVRSRLLYLVRRGSMQT